MDVQNKLPDAFAAVYAREIEKLGGQPGTYPLEMSTGYYANITIEERNGKVIIKPASARDAISIRREAEYQEKRR